MINTRVATAKAVQHQPKTVTIKDLVKTLHGYAVQREMAYKMYSGYSTSVKLEAIADIYELLQRATQCISDKEATKYVLKTALDFHYIAPSGRKEHAAWYTKIEAIMEACREYIGWRKQ